MTMVLGKTEEDHLIAQVSVSQISGSLPWAGLALSMVAVCRGQQQMKEISNSALETNNFLLKKQNMNS